MAHKSLILFLEDEAEPAEMLSAFLEMKGFEVLIAPSGRDALKLIDTHGAAIDLAVLDIMVPEPNGIDICRYIRNKEETATLPVIFLTARDEEQDEIMGLSIGADDYIPKPASLNLVLAHIQSLLRRKSGLQPAGPVIRYGSLQLHDERLEVLRNGKPVDLTASEYKILALLFKHPNRVFSRQEILENISDDEKFVFDRTVDVHVKNLRIKLGDQGKLVQTVRGIGYRLNRETVA